MTQRTDQSRTCTDAPQVTTLRSVALPAPPVRPLTADAAPWPTDADVDHALGAYGDPDPRQHSDRIGTPAAWSAFGTGGAA